MILITEDQSAAIVTPELAFAAMLEAFIAAVSPSAAIPRAASLRRGRFQSGYFATFGRCAVCRQRADHTGG